MKKEVYLGILYDYYGELLSEKQQNYFINYYFDNLSLGEISENLEVSRNAVHKQLKVIEDKLYFYEEKLKLYKKDQELEKIIDLVKDKIIVEKLEHLLK